MNCSIKDQTCICHRLNNIVKRAACDFLEDDYLIEWRQFVKRIRKSNPLSESWTDTCNILYKKSITLQPDSDTRWSSTVAMFSKAYEVREAVISLRSVVTGENKV
jgi:hypothetical protein